MRRTRNDVIVIGGGPAGMMAAGTAAENGRSVLLIEKNEKVGRKLGITGKGRCNVTNACGPDEVIRNIPTNGRFLYSAVNGFPPSEVMEFFEGLGVPLKTERGQRVFPQSDRAADIVNAMRTYMRRNGVGIVREEADGLIIENGVCVGVRTAESEHLADSVIVATGGVSYTGTGSTGDGYRFAAEAGHTVVEPRASLVALTSDDPSCGRMQGFSLKNISVRFTDSAGKELYRDFGELLFTHFGVSGPVVLSASAHLRELGRTDYYLYIDLKPALDEKKLDARLLRDFEKYSNREFSNALGDLAGRSMIPVLVEKSGIDPEKKVNLITREERMGLLRLFKAFPVHVTGAAPIETAIVTSGGVSVKEINPRTMESKLCPGLYFAGEVIDADAYTGGFNLEIAWATGRAAGRSA